MYDPNEQLTPHFRLGEFLHKGSTAELTPAILANIKNLAVKLEFIRSAIGDRPIHITSAFRTKAHNKAVGGARASYHLTGKAADIVVLGMSPRTVQSILRRAKWGGGLGCYWNFTHVDVGPGREWRN